MPFETKHTLAYIRGNHREVDLTLIASVLGGYLSDWEISKLKDKADAKSHVEKIVKRICILSEVSYPFKNGNLPGHDDTPIMRMLKGMTIPYLLQRLEDYVLDRLVGKEPLEQHLTSDLSEHALVSA